jgi:tyrosine-specific transport protein
LKNKKSQHPWYDLSKFHSLGAIFTIVGTVIGAGILGVPYVVAKAGFWTGIFVMFLVAAVLLLLFLYLGEVVLRTKGKHQLPGYAGIYLGPWGQRAMSIATSFSIFSAVIAYILAGGESLRMLFSGFIDLPAWVFSIFFFVVLASIVYFDVNLLSESEIAICSLLIVAVLLIFIFSANHIDVSNYSGFEIKNIFLPYGVIMFAFLGFVGIPEASEVMVKEKKKLKKVIIAGAVIPLILYLIFVFTIVGIMGPTTQELGTMGIENLIGTKGLIIGNLFLLFAISTSFLALSFGLKEYYFYDKKMSNFKSWAIACLVPFVLFFFVRNWSSFTGILNVSGVFFGGTQAIVVVLTALAAKKLGKRKPEYTFPINKIVAFLLIAFIVGGMISLLFNL